MPYRWLTAGLISMALAGCASETLPPRLSDEQLKAIAATHFKATVGVRRYRAPVYSDNLIEYLHKTGLFDKVDSLDAFKTPPAFIASVDEGIYGTPTIPILTFISFGFIPTSVDEDHGVVFSLTPRAEPKTRIAINFRYRGPSVLGWWALIEGALPDQTWGAADSHRRFIESLAWHIVRHEKQLSAYLN